MTKRRKQVWILALAAVATILVALSPRVVRSYWSVRSSNPVRRGVALATELGCFSCHGELGRSGLPDPGQRDAEVPIWTGGMWMMYVESDEEIRNYILYGHRGRPNEKSPEHVDSDSHAHTHDSATQGEPEIHMPAYEGVVDSAALEDLVATFKVLSGMSLPPTDSPERRGYELARSWGCFSCHGPAGSGGRQNPASFAGFIPGWYGADFQDLVRNREEFDTWIREGSIPRLAENPVAAFFMRRQRVLMPRYMNLSVRDLDGLWAYVGWLERTGGGHEGGGNPWQ